jgi:branched-chain amino acid transport system substrate-binding protein
MTPLTPVRTARLALTAIAFAALASAAGAQGTGKLKVGLMLPYSGTFTALGVAIENGFKLYVEEQGGKLAGREIEFFKVDDESDPAKATDNVNKLIKRDNVDVIVGTVHSGVAMAMAKAAKESGTVLIVPNAGADAVTGSDVRAQHLPQLVQQLAAGLRHGRSRGQAARQEKGHDHHLEVRGRRGVGQRLQGRLREGRRQG